ncbi:hypothetical protein NDU88_005909 [Pleurodeles waltl]|uniref:Uncharacterized protein n=1 Tax=Pleurodeles waltl TaxID=8319 RepID=A0AAV7PK79_PLEWA|nr:hypothetical protein NDU88_005909 [Pleurodeles waltl]
MSRTCADAAGAAPDLPAVPSREWLASTPTQEDRRSKGSASGPGESGRRGEEDGERMEDKEPRRNERSLRTGERFLHNRREVNITVAHGGPSTTVAWEDGALDPATLLEKRGSSRCVGKLP